MRRVKRMEIGKLVFSLLIFCMVAITSGCGDSSKALEVNRELKAVNNEMPLYDGSYVIEEAHVHDYQIVTRDELSSLTTDNGQPTTDNGQLPTENQQPRI